MIILVTDQIYSKTERFLHKLKYLDSSDEIVLAVLDDRKCDDSKYSRGAPRGVRVVNGTVDDIARYASGSGCEVRIVTLNQSGLIPGLALAQTLGIPRREFVIKCCDKIRTREILCNDKILGLDFAHFRRAEELKTEEFFPANKYVVKPCYGTSGRDVKKCDSWEEAVTYAKQLNKKEELLSQSVRDTCKLSGTQSGIIEPYVQGTEFSVDGWTKGGKVHAVVQQKLYTIEGSFFGDGPTISPPVTAELLGPEYLGLKITEPEAKIFAKRVLDMVGFYDGVFHIEARERAGDFKPCLIEVNPRAPGGFLWKTVLLRTGYDLELLDAAIQLGASTIPKTSPQAQYVLHYPLYAFNSGVVSDLGDFGDKRTEIPDLDVEFVVDVGHEFKTHDLTAEPYIGFVVIADSTFNGLMKKWEEVRNLRHPIISQIDRA